MTDPVDTSKRWFLTKAASAAGAVGVAFAASPFISSMQPSARAQAAGAPVEVDIDKLEPGQLIRVLWRGKPVWVLHRTPESLADLPKLNSKLRDPDSKESDQPEGARNEARAIRPEIFVALGVCTHLGCSPTYRPEIAPADLGPDWQGGFFCPCHGSLFDLAGRVYKGVPAPKNLEIPPYRYLSDSKLVVGVNGEQA
ncbi:ubiquinol-cytochrome c reductase iron-sulfur subunit [Methylococcus sp. EFPC2]|uniref:ubiquinol-cytochrome c reductase iron-sulfur subunit n=1 Tax=Methylococcus sp. EFPC2 TaxID=2812648 RepID=UPI0019689CA2|nr:ubiquinol-cytochrome c reductase iron-sulfur subunit [Methylococcus sp. EFPC2]QSA98707.1 ubiquinol-cytochrome c reductase iron-sulfur subunit [Methylococcus sp. EFPC2]